MPDLTDESRETPFVLFEVIPTDRPHRADQMLAAIEKGLVALDRDLRITWSNRHFLKWCDGTSPIGKPFLEAIGEVEAVPAQGVPFERAFAGETVQFRIQLQGKHHLSATIWPVRVGTEIVELVALCDDVTSEVLRQQKLDALHRAGQELAVLDPEQLTEMDIDCRVDLLKQNLRRHIHNLLHYDVIEIRLLDRATGKLDPLMEEGMTPEAAHRELYARMEGNGVTGYVAATGASYLCQDTANDPYFIEGSPNARSSMTVPIVFQDQVIGTFNVESPHAHAFGSEDLQFAELFSRELAQTLYTLNLLSAQQNSTATQAIEAVNREIALPADELLAIASRLLDRAKEIEPDWVDSLQRINRDTRAIKEKIQTVGESFAGLRANLSTRRLKGMHVLVIDSDDRIRKSAHVMLERLGCQVETAATAVEGIALAHNGTYEGVLMDIKHPDMGGYAAYRAVRDSLPTAQVVLTAVFGYDSSHTIVKARQDGLKYLIFKPFRLDQVLKALTSPVDAKPS